MRMPRSNNTTKTSAVTAPTTRQTSHGTEDATAVLWAVPVSAFQPSNTTTPAMKRIATSVCDAGANNRASFDTSDRRSR
jgi:hypothetical protein